MQELEIAALNNVGWNKLLDACSTVELVDAPHLNMLLPGGGMCLFIAWRRHVLIYCLAGANFSALGSILEPLGAHLGGSGGGSGGSGGAL